MAGRVRAEGCVACPTGVFHGVTCRTGRAECLIVQADPIGIQMRFRFRTAADLDLGDKVIFPGDYRNRVTDITLETDRLFLRIEMLPIMTAETTRCINVPKIVRVCCPIH